MCLVLAVWSALRGRPPATSREKAVAGRREAMSTQRVGLINANVEATSKQRCRVHTKSRDALHPRTLASLAASPEAPNH